MNDRFLRLAKPQRDSVLMLKKNNSWNLILALRTQKIELNPNNKQSTCISKHCGYRRVAFNFALSSFKTGLDNDEWRTEQDIRKEFNAVKYDKFDWCKELSQNASKNAIRDLGDAVTRWNKGQNKFPVSGNARSDQRSMCGRYHSGRYSGEGGSPGKLPMP